MVFFDASGTRRWYAFALGSFLLCTVCAVSIIGVHTLRTKNIHTPVSTSIVVDMNDPRFEKTLALTFDDGPHPTYTQDIIEILRRENVPATFFVVGEHVVRHPRITRAIVENGFEIGNHSFTHREEVHASPERIRAEIIATDRAIAFATGQTTSLYRPPFLLDIGGEAVDGRLVENANLRTIESLGAIAVGTDLDPTDWDSETGDSALAIYEKLIGEVEEGGHVVLLHDHGGQGATLEALQRFIAEMKTQGYTFVPVSYYFGLPLHGVDASITTYTLFSEYPLLLFLGGTILGGIVISLLSMLIATIGLTRMWVIVASRRLIVPFTRRTSRRHHENTPETILISTPHATLRAQWRTPARDSTSGVAVVIPAYNEAANIEATVRSILANSVVPDRIVVVDDGSTDITNDIVCRLLAEYAPRLSLITRENSGSKADALNAAIPHLLEKIVIAIDADTVLDPYAIEHLIPHFDDEEVGAVAGKIYPATTKTLIEKFQYLEYVQGQNLDKTVFSVGNAVGIVPGAIGAWRREALEKVGGYSHDTVVEDQDLTLSLLAHGYAVRFEPHALAYTETPSTAHAFFRQRFRWMYGTLQCFKKYQAWLFSREKPWLGFVVLPNIIIFNIIFPLLTPVIDGLVLASLFGAVNGSLLVSAFLMYLALDMWFACESLLHEKKSRYTYLWYVVLQRWFYRYVIAAAVFKSVIVAALGSAVPWGIHHRRGAAHHALSHNCTEIPATLMTHESAHH